MRRKVPNLKFMEETVFSSEECKSPVSKTKTPESIPTFLLLPHSPEIVQTTSLSLHKLDTVSISSLPFHSPEIIPSTEKRLQCNN